VADNASALETIEQLVVRDALVPPDALARARLARDETGEPLDAVITRLGLVSEQALAAACARALNVPLVDAAAMPEQPLAPDAISARFLRAQRLIPVAL
jgi:general secretion pathway protein E